MLAALLRQNPRFHADIESPLAELFTSFEAAMGADRETAILLNKNRRANILRGIVDGFYRDNKKPVIFDTHRGWSARIPTIAELYPDAKVILCIRELGWVIDSLERLHQHNLQQPNATLGWRSGGTVFDRTNLWMNSNGLVGFCCNAVMEAASGDQSKVMLIDYEHLCRDPRAELSRLYEFIGESPYRHDFKEFFFESQRFDERIGLPGMHTVSGPVAWRPRKSILPAQLFHSINAKNFWR